MFKNQYLSIEKGDKYKAFTLVELIVVIIILAILTAISFLSISNYLATTRDAKRLSDITELYKKIEIAKEFLGIENLVNPTSSGWAMIGGVPQKVHFGTVNFQVLKENELNFVPSREGELYLIAYSIGTFKKNGKELGYTFVQLKAESETSDKPIIVGNYYQLNEDTDVINLFVLGSTEGWIPYEDCTLNGQTILHGNAITAYETSSVPYGNTCKSETRICNNGALSGTYAYSSCTTEGASSCTHLGETINHNGTMTVYSEGTIAWTESYDCSNRRGQVTCNNGVVSGNTTFAYKICSKGTATNCTSTTMGGYTIPTTNHGNTTATLTRTGSLSGGGLNGYLEFKQTFTCNNGTFTGNGETETLKCNTGYIQSGSTCILPNGEIPIELCTTGAGQMPTTTAKANPSCSATDIIICTKVGYGHQISACNLGTSTAGTASSSYGNRYQWGRNDTGFTKLTTWPPRDWVNPGNDNLWGNTTDNPLGSNFAARQGPCPSGRHVPSTLEWDSLVKTWFSSKGVSCTASAGSTCGWNGGASFANFQSNLKLSLAGSVSWTDGAVVSGPGYYWSSTPDGGVDTAYLLTFSSTSVNIQFGGNPRAAGASVRCFKN